MVDVVVDRTVTEVVLVVVAGVETTIPTRCRMVSTHVLSLATVVGEEAPSRASRPAMTTGQTATKASTPTGLVDLVDTRSEAVLEARVSREVGEATEGQEV